MDSLRDIVSLPVLQSRLSFMLNSLYANISAGSYSTQEQLNRAIFNIVKTMSNGVNQPIYDLGSVYRGSPPDREEINNALIKVYNELRVLSDVLYKTGSSVESNFNFAVAKIRKLQAGIKYCDQQLAVYSLYLTDDANSHHFGETFSSEEFIDKGSKFLSEEECLINLEEGTVSLPPEAEKEVWRISKISLGERSNCVIGNNIQANVPVRGRLNAVHDGNVDTWTEFERVVAKEDLNQITVELKLTLEDVKVVNGIRIVPVLLGARTPLTLESIQVSAEGRVWTSLDKEISVAEFLGENDEDRYHLSPHTGKFSGEFNATFPPRFVRFIRITLHQSSAFNIRNSDGQNLLRYAIGLKEIEVYGLKYKDVGEFISKEITFPGSMRAVALRSTFDPIELPPEAGNVEYQISFDDGTSWQQISRQRDSLLDIPEVVFPPEGQSSLRYKVKLTKNEEAFAAYRRENTEDDVHQTFGWGDNYPLKLKLAYKPVPGTLTVCDPEVATVGSRYPRISIGRGVLSTDDRTNSVRTGATVLRRKVPLPASVDVRDLNIIAGGYIWTRVSSFTGSAWYDRVYTLLKSNDGTLEVTFGNGSATDPRGLIPSPDQEVSAYLSDEPLTIETIESPFIATLDHPSDGNKQHTSIFFDGESTRAPAEVIPGGVKKFQLKHYPVDMETPGAQFTIKRYKAGTLLPSESRLQEETTITIVSGPSGPLPDPFYNPHGNPPQFNDYRTFVDGYSELVNANDWTLDSDNGVLYFYNATPIDYVVYFQGDVVDRRFLRDEDWDFVEGTLNQIQIYESGYFNVTRNTSGSSGNGSVTLPVLHSGDSEAHGIVPKSVKLSSLTSTKIFGEEYNPFEVPFIDGKTEFEQKGFVQEETVPTLTAITPTIESFVLESAGTFDSTAPVSFSDRTIFDEQKPYEDGSTELTAVNQWSVDPNTGTVYIYLDSGETTQGITVSYVTTDEFSQGLLIGAYSVDIKKGVVHFAGPAQSNFTVEFKQAPYGIRYSMSYQLEEGKRKDYTVDRENRELTVTRVRSEGARKTLSIRYKYEPEDEDLLTLADYFSPLLRGLSVKAALL